MIEFGTKYRPGRRTFIYLLIKDCWWLWGLGIAFGYLAFAMYAGSLNAWAVQFLASNPQWFIDVGMLSQWAALFSAAFFLIAYLRVSVEYRRYSFRVDDHAFHLNRGLIRLQEITIPYKQISNVHIEQPYLWRLWGLAKLDITISNSRDALRLRKRREFLIPCIDKSLARTLSHFLVKQASGYDDDEDDEDEDYDDEDDAEDVAIAET